MIGVKNISVNSVAMKMAEKSIKNLENPMELEILFRKYLEISYWQVDLEGRRLRFLRRVIFRVRDWGCGIV